MGGDGFSCGGESKFGDTIIDESAVGAGSLWFSWGLMQNDGGIGGLGSVD